MASEVYLIRHGQTIGNLTGARLHNPGLTDLGRAQAAALAAALRAERPAPILSSPLLRALETASAIAAATGAPLLVWNDLVEMNGWQPYSSSPRDELRRLFPRAELEPDMPEAGWSYPGPEDAAAGWARAARVVRRVSALPGERVAVVAHGTFNAMLLCTWLRARVDGAVGFAQDNGAMSRLTVAAGRTVLHTCNDVAHLPPEVRS
jgi:broad specificity phosphatase PhoE